MYEVLFRIEPWELENIDNIEDLKIRLIKYNIRPSIPNEDLHKKDKNMKILIMLMKKCWEHEIIKRPNTTYIFNELYKIINSFR